MPLGTLSGLLINTRRCQQTLRGESGHSACFYLCYYITSGYGSQHIYSGLFRGHLPEGSGRSGTFPKYPGSGQAFLPQQYLYFLPDPHGQGSFLPIFFGLTIVPDFFCSM